VWYGHDVLPRLTLIEASDNSHKRINSLRQACGLKTGVNGKAKLLRKNKMDAIHRPLGSVHLFDSGLSQAMRFYRLVKEKLPLE
jgi:hypothetical protein